MQPHTFVALRTEIVWFMKLHLSKSYFLIFLISRILTSCEEDVQVLTKPEFTPVVYCLLDPADSIQTVRISRVFQDRIQQSEWENKYDSYLSDSLKLVYLEHTENSGEHFVWNFKMNKQLRQVNDSTFAVTYLFTTSLRPSFSTTYQLYVYFPETKKMASSSITTLANVQLFDPASVPGRKIVIDPTQPYVMRWSGAPGTAYYQGQFNLNYLEEYGGQITGKTITMPMNIVLNYNVDPVISQNVGGMHLLLTLKDQIPVKEGVRRKLTTIDFTLYFGGTEIALFANSGMSPKGLEGMVQDFSNLDNARGLFSSISAIYVKDLYLSNQSIDTIALNNLTRSLNFLKSHEDF